MGLISGKCPNCGANLKISDNAKGELTCPFCGGTYLVENAINVINNETINNNNFAGANVIINQNAKDAYIKQYLENARRAFNKEDWEEVEKYYNMVEQYAPNNMEAVFFSSFGKTMLSLTDADYYKREQKFGVLIKSISVINDYFEKTDENKEEVLKKISDAIEKMYSVNFIYQEITTQSLTPTVATKKYTITLENSVREAFLTELKQIKEVNPNLDYIDELISKNSEGKPTGGCYVATCVYGSYDCPQVWTLRRYRDYKLAKTWYGRIFIRTYYATSPTLVKWFGKTNWFKNMWKPKLDKMVETLKQQGFDDTPYEDKKW